MTKIILQSITLSYFKGIKSLHLDLNEDISCIYADNGCGKTTISDAFMWTLFGKNTEGRTDFGIKTLDTNGNVIPNVEHSVTLSLLINGTKRDIKRQWVEERVTRRGVTTDEVKHHGEFFVDGMSYTKKDFDTFISSIIGEQTFRAVTNPLYFLNLPWKEQRRFLQDMTGAVDFSSLKNNKRFEDILHTDQFKTIEEYLQHLRYNIRQVKDKIEQIPARIEEQTRTCPPLLDWDALNTKLTEFGQLLKEKNSLLSDLRHGSESASRKTLRDRIEFTRKRIDEMFKSAYNMTNEDYSTYTHQTDALRNELVAEQNVLKALETKLKSNEAQISQVKQSLVEIAEKKKQANEDWNNLKKSRFVTPESPECPLCHRPYEGADYEREVEKLRQSFNEHKVSEVARITELAQKLKEDTATAEALVNSFNTEIAQTQVLVETQTLKLQNVQNRIEAHTKNTPPTAEQRLADNPNYQQAKGELAELESRLESDITADNSETIANLVSEINDLQSQYEAVFGELSTQAFYNEHQHRIEELKAEQTTLNTQLDELLQKEDVAVDYQSAENELIEQAVNKHFSLVRFQLFDTLNDGTKKPNCIAYVNGVPYADLNSSAKLNAGRDVLNALSKYYEVYAPVLSDNAEGTNTFLPILSQDIRLYVSTDKQLTLR